MANNRWEAEVQTKRDWIEISIYRIADIEEFPRFLYFVTGEYMEQVGTVYERKCLSYRLGELAKGRVLKHAMLSPGRTYIAVVDGIGEVARATSNA